MKLFTMAYRMILAAYCFLQFSVQVLWLGKWAMPRIMKSHGQSLEERNKALLHAHKHVSFFINTIDRLGWASFDFRGTAVAGAAVIVPNHPSLIDFIVLLRDYPNAVCLYKTQTLENPFLSDFVKTAGYIEGMDGTREASKRIVDECCQRLGEGHQVVFFPEGTRSKSNASLGRFRSTGFHAAILSGAPVQPVVIYCEPLFLGKNQSWTEFSKNKNRMIIEYLAPIYVDDLQEGERSAKGLSNHVRRLIKTHLATLKAESGCNFS